jgi:DNA-binding transcriptional MocR family regulator
LDIILSKPSKLSKRSKRSNRFLGERGEKLKAERLARKGIFKITSYIPGKSIEEVQKEFGGKKWIKLASNENLLGPSPKAVAAIRKELRNIYLYPEGPCTVLRQALARKFSLPEEMVVISNGADNLILMIACAFVDEGNEVVMAAPTFSVYTNVTQIMGGRPIKVRLKDFTHDLERQSWSLFATQIILREQLFLKNPLTIFSPNFRSRSSLSLMKLMETLSKIHSIQMVWTILKKENR